jgi:hypothetical protein
LEVLAKGVLLAGFSQDGDTKNFGIDPSVYDETSAVVYDSSMTFNCGKVKTYYYSGNYDAKKCEYIKGNQITKSGLTNDAFIYRFKLSNTKELSNFNCTNDLDSKAHPANVGDMVTAYIYVDKDTNNRPTLYCKAKTDSYTTMTAQALVYDVEKLVVKYGVHNKQANNPPAKLLDLPNKTKNPLPPDKFYFTDAAGVNAIDPVTGTNNWKNVFAIKLFFVLHSAEKNLTRTLASSSYKIEGVAQTPLNTAEKRLYKVFSKTIFLRASE